MRNTQCISNSICNCWSRTNRACLADTFHTKWVNRGWSNGAIGLKAGKLRSQRHGIIHQCCRQNLAIDKQLVELPSTVVNRDVTLDLRLTGILIHLDHTDMCTEGVGQCCWLPESRCLQTWLNTRMQCIGKIGRCSYLSKGNGFLRRTSHKELAILQRHVRSASFQHVGSDLLH